MIPNIFTMLTADAAVTAAVDDRIYPVRAPVGAALPYVVYTVVSSTPDPDFTSTTPTTQYRMQVDVYAATFPAVHSVHEAVQAALNGYGTPLGVNLDTLEDSPDGDADGGTYRISFDQSFWQ